MKLKLITKLILVVPLLLGGTACQKQTVSEVHDTVVIKTTLAAKTPATLVGGGTASGVKGISESKIITQPNTTGADRTGTIRLKAGSYTGTYTFTQAGK